MRGPRPRLSHAAMSPSSVRSRPAAAPTYWCGCSRPNCRTSSASRWSSRTGPAPPPRSPPTPSPRAPPDGYTLLLAPITTLAIGPSVFKKLPYDTVKDFAPVGLVGSAQFALVANPSLGAKTLPELIKIIKSKNGQMSYASSGASTPHHLFMEMFLKMIGAKAQHVPYRGSGPAVTDVASGQVPMMMVDLAVALPLIRAGKVVAYGVTSPARVKATPEISDHRRGRPAGLCRHRLVLGGGAGRHAAADHRQAQRRADGLSQAAGRRDSACRRWRSSRAPARRTSSEVHRQAKSPNGRRW